jgi:hypothetical protein
MPKAKRRLADEYDAAQQRGEVSTGRGRSRRERQGHRLRPRLDPQGVHEARPPVELPGQLDDDGDLNDTLWCIRQFKLQSSGSDLTIICKLYD